MLIGFDASRAFLKENTGTENYSLNLLKALAKIDAKNNYLIYLRYSENLIVKKFFPENFQFKVIKPYRLWTQIGLAMETWKNPVDILFIPAHTLPILRRRSFMVNGLSGKNTNPHEPSGINDIQSHVTKNGLKRLTKYVVTIHDLGVEYLPGFHKFPDKYYLDFASRYAANNADLIIAVSKETKKDLIKRYKIDQSNIFVINEGVDKTFFKPSSMGQIKSVKNKYKIDGNYFLFVGTIQPRKNLMMLIEAYSLFVKTYSKKNNISKYTNHDYRKKQSLVARQSLNLSVGNDEQGGRFTIPKLVICGKKGWDYGRIIDRPIELGIPNLVLFLDYVPKGDLPALYSGSIAFLYPSLFEGFGLPILESLACCCPVIASDIGPNREIFSKINKEKILQEDTNNRAYSKKGSAYFSQARNDSRKWKKQNTDRISEKMADFGKVDKFEAMALVDPEDKEEWSRLLYQYITMYNNRKLGKSRRILSEKSYNWKEVAQKTLSVFEKVYDKK